MLYVCFSPCSMFTKNPIKTVCIISSLVTGWKAFILCSHLHKDKDMAVFQNAAARWHQWATRIIPP